MKPKYKNIALKTIRILLGIIFMASGIGKLISGSDAQYLVELMATEFYWLIEYSSLIVISTSILELILAVFLLWGRYLKWALSGTLLMLIGFSSVLSYFYFQGMSVENCGCFGALGFASGLEFTLLRNMVLIFLIVGAFLLIRSQNE
ncbi:DoxX family membrane protein [Aliifodinibius salicampi]|uniref:DoxX family membrane protein n=1 Tax=Fodinibius salicampi TaxID=1920655 RepID=A0ABT3Q358_9BACT|nr:MauE/DoxX family redox-associated membrane protein [Fodinibius salicampi]MCW9714538.1 DoxX family membrane protein [Fodinibius salicampi]